MSTLQYVKGIGPKLAKTLEKLGILTPKDLLYYFPKSYDDRRALPKIIQAEIGQTHTIMATVKSISEETPKEKVHLIKCLLQDETAPIIAIWFNQPYIKRLLSIGKPILVKGKIDINPYTKQREISIQDTEIVQKDPNKPPNTQCIVPVYLLTHGLYQSKLRDSIFYCIQHIVKTLTDPLPTDLREKLNLLPLKNALESIHFPKDSTQYQQARNRLVFDELFYYQLGLLMHQNTSKIQVAGIPLNCQNPLITQHLQTLPYTLTNAQNRVIQEIATDINAGHCLNRMIQGDVGSGKTDVAAVAILMAIGSGKNAAIMAPTEILATQHAQKFTRYFEALNIPVLLIKGKMRKKEKDAVLAQLQSDTPYIVVGTHALIEDPIVIPKLAMAIIDEQHRFGVMQRMRLQEKGQRPHCLFMTATPIPRTLMLTVYGDLDKSIIDEMPPGRSPVKTAFFKENKLADVYQFCRNQIQNGEQVFMVYPLVEESEKLDLNAAIDAYDTLRNGPFSALSCGLIHGRMSPDEKQAQMQRFKDKKDQVLVATTVIEVGIDIPNATVMVIQNAERFGLSQLHQLRGRVGRGQKAAYCFLIANPKSDSAKQRIKAMLDTHDGFKIAEADLQIRGPGDMLGTRQAGLPNFNLADLVHDEKILSTCRNTAKAILASDPDLNHPQYKALKETLYQNPLNITEKSLN